jgi:hypothetical protein
MDEFSGICMILTLYCLLGTVISCILFLHQWFLKFIAKNYVVCLGQV